jgi:cysteine-rich repeat protein
MSCADVFLRDREAGTTTLVSVPAGGGLADGGSSGGSGVSNDGSAMVFLSDATNLVSGDTNGKRDLFLRAAVCGDGVRELGEECDDGNTTEADGCSATCRLDCTTAPRPRLEGRADDRQVQEQDVGADRRVQTSEQFKDRSD